MGYLLMQEGKKKTWSLTWILLELAVIFSVFSQIGPLETIARPGMYAIWISVLLAGCVKNGGRIVLSRFSVRFLIAYVLFCLLCATTGLFDGNHLSTNYLRVLLVPLLVTIVGDMYANEDNDLLNRIGRLYLICSVVYAIWVHATFFPSYSAWLVSRIYLFPSKNSAGQIWASAIYVSILLLDKRNIFERILVYIACGYLLLMIGISQCRTVLLGIIISLLAFFISRTKKKVKWIAFLSLLAIVAWVIPITRQFIEQALFLSKFEGGDFNTFSSLRVVKNQAAFMVFLSSPFIGIGEYYVDNSYLLILAESGLIGFCIIEWIWAKKIAICFKYRGKTSEQTFLFMMTVFYIIESILEGFPPFGPGVSSLMFWLLSILLVARSNRELSNQQTDQSLAFSQMRQAPLLKPHLKWQGKVEL